MEAKLYIRNLSYETTEDHLCELFTQTGGVISVALIKEPGTNRSTGFAFVANDFTGRSAKGDQHVQWTYPGQTPVNREYCPFA